MGLGRELEIFGRHTEVVVRESGYEAHHFEHCLRHNRFVEASVQLLQRDLFWLIKILVDQSC